MKGKNKMASGGRNSRAEVEKEAHSETDGFNKGGATKKANERKMHGKKAGHRHDKRHRNGKFAKGGAVFSEAEKVKQRPGFGEQKIDASDE